MVHKKLCFKYSVLSFHWELAFLYEFHGEEKKNLTLGLTNEGALSNIWCQKSTARKVQVRCGRV